MLKPIKHVMPAPLVKMGDIMVYQPLPNNWTDIIDPFLLLHHWRQEFEGGQKQRETGVGPHPHCGFSPVTLIFEGGVHHRDSLGHNSKVASGGMQWIDSGKGIVHSERPLKTIAENGGPFEIIQFWINTPAARKKKAPAYFAFHSDEIPVYQEQNGKCSIKIIAGALFEVRAKHTTASPLNIFVCNFKKGCSINVPVSEKYNTFIYQLKGDLVINDEDRIGRKTMVWFENEGDEIKLSAEKDALFVFFSGRPINEKTVSYGPFVVNNESELLTAMRDYQIGKMGILIEEFD